jgi:hypothetical protein
MSLLGGVGHEKNLTKTLKLFCGELFCGKRGRVVSQKKFMGAVILFANVLMRKLLYPVHFWLSCSALFGA